MSRKVFVSSRVFTSASCLALTLVGPAIGQGPQNGLQGSLLPPGTQPGGTTDVVDFEGIPTGTILATVFASGGSGPIEVRGSNPRLGAVNAAVIFDSSNPTGGDFDLGSPNVDFGGPGVGDGGSDGSPFENDFPLGKVLIVAEDLDDGDGDGLIDDPDDSNDAGTMRFDFSAIAPVTVLGLTIIDVEDDRDQPLVEFLDAGGLLLATEFLPFVGDNGVGVIDLGAVSGVFSMVVRLNGSGAIDDLVFQEQCKAGIGDTVWHDVDGDGLRDPAEPGIEGVVLSLLDDLGQEIGTDVTDRRGRYSFTDLCAGGYKVVIDPESLPSGFVPAPCDVGNDDEIDNDCSPVSVTLPTNATVDNSVDFGFVAPCSGSIGDFVWLDLDGDGLQGDDEPGIEGITIVLRDVLGNELSSMTTLPGGFYDFMGLCAGTYIVDVDESTLPSNYLPAPCDVGGDDTIDNDCSPVVVVLGADDTRDPTVDFGYVSMNDGIIGNFVWIDLQCDGLQSGDTEGSPGDDLGVGDVGVILSDDMGVILNSTTTFGDGRYRFAGLADGTYVVSIDDETLPDGLIEAPCDVGDDDTVDNDCSPETVVLDSREGTAGNVNLTIDFGYITPVCGEEGCGVGYWKQPHHHDSWPAPYTPDTLFADVFEEDAFPGDTLQDVLEKRAGGLDALGRHTVASLLNAQSDDVPYPLPTSVVIQLFDDTVPGTTREYLALKDFFEDLNETSCPLN